MPPVGASGVFSLACSWMVWQIFGERLKSQVAKPQPQTAHEKTLAPRVSDAVTKTKLVKLWDRLLYPGRTKNKPGS